MKNKKGQFYLLTAVIFITLLFGILKTNTMSLNNNSYTQRNFKYYYDLEAKNIINNAFYQDKNVSLELDYFTKSFINYYNSKNINLKIINIYKNQELIIYNYAKEQIIINPGNITLNNSLSIKIPITNISITFNKISYDYKFNSNPVQFKSLIIEEK